MVDFVVRTFFSMPTNYKRVASVFETNRCWPLRQVRNGRFLDKPECTDYLFLVGIMTRTLNI